jgi:hypothetical protein
MLLRYSWARPLALATSPILLASITIQDGEQYSTETAHLNPVSTIWMSTLWLILLGSQNCLRFCVLLRGSRDPERSNTIPPQPKSSTERCI